MKYEVVIVPNCNVRLKCEYLKYNLIKVKIKYTKK